MRPVHDLVFAALRNLPQDGTFDQEGCVSRLLARVNEKLRERNGEEFTVYSYDLSSATDRIPVHLYQELLSHIIGFEEATLWKHLLTARKWWDRDSVWTPDEGLQPTGAWLPRLYAVGQPMGAYSSWALLALAHHAIVQYCHGLLGRQGWFEDYGIVGDDIVILDPELALRYREVMTELGVDISVDKSLISSLGTFEFCKRLVTPEGDVSGIPIRLLFQAFEYPSDAAVLIRHLYRRGFSLLPIAVTRAFSSLSRVRVDLKKSIRTYPVGLRVALATMVMPSFPWWGGIQRLVHILRLPVEDLEEVIRLDLDIPTDILGAYARLEMTAFRGYLARFRPGKWADSLIKVSPGIRRMLMKSWVFKGRKYVAGTWGPIQVFLLWGTPLGWWVMRDFIHRLFVSMGWLILSFLEAGAIPRSQAVIPKMVFIMKRFRDRCLESFRVSPDYLGAVAKARTRPSFELTFFPSNERKERMARRVVQWPIRALQGFKGTLPPYYSENAVGPPRGDD
jgi:hypothetical protein